MKLVFTRFARADLRRLRKFIAEKNPAAATRAAKRIKSAAQLLIEQPLVGHPVQTPDGETREDIRDIIDLSKEIVRLARGRGKKAKLNISASAFVPKAHTPFMWVPQISLEESIRRISMIRDALRRSPIHVKWNQPETPGKR